MTFGTSVLLNAYTLATNEDVATNSIGAEFIDSCGISFSLSSVTGTTKSGTCLLQASFDGTNWFNVPSATVAAADVATQTVGFSSTGLSYKFLRGYFDGHADITGGTLTVTIGYRTV